MFLDRNKGRKQILFRQRFPTWANRETLIGHMMFLQQCFLVCSGLYKKKQIPRIDILYSRYYLRCLFSEFVFILHFLKLSACRGFRAL